LLLGFGQGFGCEEDWIPDDGRNDCHPEIGASEQECRARNCTWCPAQFEGTPWCYFPSNPTLGGYYMDGEPVETENGWL